MTVEQAALRRAAHGDTYDFLLGRWWIERTYVERRRQERGTFSGVLDVAATRGAGQRTARYVEEGRFALGTYQGQGKRRLEVVEKPTGAVALVFEDGRPFVDCDLASGAWRTAHRCGEDRYEISWQVVSHDEVTERWRVTGPQKDYDAWAVLRRTAPTCDGVQRTGRQVATISLAASTSTTESPAAGSTRSTS